jgi:hypothetical protein
MRVGSMLLGVVLAMGFATRGWGGEVPAPTRDTWTRVAHWTAHEGTWARALAIDGSGRWAVTGGPDRWLRFWALPSGEARASVRLPRTSG